jgi:hypothetical protein
MLTRRQLLSLLPAGLMLPSATARAAEAPEQRFLFVYVRGGWDVLTVFAPKFDAPLIDMEAGAAPAEVHGIPFVDHEDRPATREFLELWGDQTCLINGIEVRSITHERCRRILFTGGSGEATDDWPVMLASNTLADYRLPHLVLAGPAFTSTNASKVVRAGQSGQLGTLIDGSALDRSDLSVQIPSELSRDAQRAFLESRLERFAAASPAGSHQRFSSLYQEGLFNAEAISGQSLSLDPDWDGCNRDLASDMMVAFDAFEAGLARCAITESQGWCETGWDTHTNNAQQGLHFEQLFGYLSEALADLATRTDTDGQPLAGRVTVVLLSEMGRHPQFNTGSGRDHWTWTSAMLVGGATRGGQVIGGFDDELAGLPLDEATGELDDGGTTLLPGHLGATLLAMADIDPGDHLPRGEQPLLSALS